MQKPQSHTTQQQQSVQTPLQHQTLASHLYPVRIKKQKVDESISSPWGSDISSLLMSWIRSWWKI